MIQYLIKNHRSLKTPVIGIILLVAVYYNNNVENIGIDRNLTIGGILISFLICESIIFLAKFFNRKISISS